MIHCKGLVNEEPARTGNIILKENEFEATGAISAENLRAVVAPGPIKLPFSPFGRWLLSSHHILVFRAHSYNQSKREQKVEFSRISEVR